MISDSPQIQVLNVSFAFPPTGGRGSEPVLRDISLTVKRGEFLCIVGPSGCGKTTLLQLIAGLLVPQLGQIVIRSHEPGAQAAVPCTLVFQDLNLFYWETTLENVALALRARGIDKVSRSDLAASLLERVGLAPFKDYYPHELSGGMCQRLALARALATNASTLLLDEPFSNLDQETRLPLENDLLRLWSEKELTVVMVTHDLRQAIRLGDRVIVLSPREPQIRMVEEVDLPRPRTEDEELFKTKEKSLCKSLKN